MFKEFEVVTLLEDVSQGGNAAKAGEIGTIVHIYPEIDAFTVEFNHGVVYEGDILDLLPHQVRHAKEEDFEREKHELEAQARAAGRTHNFWRFNFITLTEDVSEDDTVIKAGALGSVEEVYKDAILVDFERGTGRESDRVIIQPHQARLATREDIERERRKRELASQPIAD